MKTTLKINFNNEAYNLQFLKIQYTKYFRFYRAACNADAV